MGQQGPPSNLHDTSELQAEEIMAAIVVLMPEKTEILALTSFIL